MDLLQKMKHAERRNMLKETRFFCISASILSVCTRLCKGSNWTVWSLNSCNAFHTALLLMCIQLKNESILKLTVAPGLSFNRMFPFMGTGVASVQGNGVFCMKTVDPLYS